MSYLERMIDLRETHNFTQAYVAGYLQIAQNTYSDYERGKGPANGECADRAGKAV